MASRGPTLTVVSRRLTRLLSLIAVLALVAAACGGSDAETEAAPAPATDDAAASTDDAPDDTAGDDDAAPADDATTGDAGSGDDVQADWPHTFVADQVGGGQLDANDLAGQDVILWFWAPW